MQTDIRQESPRRSGGIGKMLILAAFVQAAEAADYRFGYSNSYYYPYGVHENFRLRREIDHLGEQMKRQQRQLDEQMRHQVEQTRLLKQQQSEQLRITGRQACYYRTNGSLDLCDRLFSGTSTKHAACVKTVKEMNSGCAEDFSWPEDKSGG